MSWSQSFDDPVKLPSGDELKTLADARAHLLKLPKSQHRDHEVQAAIEALLMAAEKRGPMMHAHVGILMAIRRGFKRKGITFSPLRPVGSADLHGVPRAEE